MNFNKLFKLLEPAPFPNEMTDEKQIDKTYRYWRVRIFYSLFLGYVFFYFTRKSFTFAIPYMIKEFGFTKAKVGLLGTIFCIVYGSSKFLSGIISDRSNPRYFMSIGLILTGIFNILFGLSSHIYLFAIFWGINGIFQGWGWPPITKQLTHWYSKKERGAWWSIIAISHNVGGAIIPIVVTFCARQMGWRYAMYIPGIICIIMGLMLFNRLRDIPQSLGLPPIEKYKNDEEIYKNNSKCRKGTNVLSAKQILFEQVLSSKFIWLLAVAYFYTYVVRTAVNDWTVLFLIQEKGYSEVAASLSIAWFETGGLIGMLIAGWSTDRFLKGKRVSFMIFCAVGMVFAVSALNYLPPVSIYIDYVLLGIIGFMVYGPQMLVGIVAAETVDKKAACTANGFVGCWAYVGGAVAGYPLGVMIDKSWELYHIVLIACCVALMLVLISFTFFAERKAKNKKLVNEFKDFSIDEA